MRRGVVVVLVVLAALVILSPGIIGWLAERDLQDGIESARVTSPEITISTERFERGWFTSEGRHRIELSDRATFPALARFVDHAGYDNMPALIVESHIDHGIVPVGAFSHDEGSLAPGIASMVSTLQFDPGNGSLIDLPGDIATKISLMGNTHMAISVSEGEWNDSDALIAWAGAELEVVVGASGNVSSLNGFIAPMTLSTERETMDTGRIDVSLAQEPREYGLMAGIVEIESEAITTRDKFGSEFGVSALSMHGATDVDDGRFSASSSADITGITLPDFGKVDLGFDFAVDGLEAESFSLIYQAYNDAAVNDISQQPFAAIYPAMETELQQLLSAGGKIKIDRLDITLQQGTIETDLILSLPESNAGDAFSWPGLLLKLDASMNLRMSAELFELMKAMYPETNKALALGFLVPDGDHYIMNVEVDAGMAMVNGAPMQLPTSGF